MAASSWIGPELARECARHGFDLVVAAEDEFIHEAADRLRVHGSAVHAVRTDLATRDGVELLVGDLRALSRPANVVVLNAGIGRAGAFLDTDPEDSAKVIDVNVSSTVHLARCLLPDMAGRGEGWVLITSSVAAELPGPYNAVYNASKAFPLSFARALREELRDTGSTFTALVSPTGYVLTVARATCRRIAVMTNSHCRPLSEASYAYDMVQRKIDGTGSGCERRSRGQAQCGSGGSAAGPARDESRSGHASGFQSQA